MVTRKNDEAVSPVIGVILMVAITVILAAVIAAFVFGMSGNISKTKVVAVTAQQPSPTTITITYQGGQDSKSFVSGNVTVTTDPSTASPATVNYVASIGGTTGGSAGYPDNKLGGNVGSWVTATGTFSGKDHVVAVGEFTDSTSQVLLDTYL